MPFSQFFLTATFLLVITVNAAHARTHEKKRDESGCIAGSSTIEQKLSCLTGVTFSEITDNSAPAGTRLFDIRFTQPTDHAAPEGETFKQRLVLSHRGESEPMILQTSGYSIFRVGQATLTSMFGANQIQVEHRFFSDSTPASHDWSKLDIKQSADDFHAITVAFKQIYPARWVNTGASKGGMTSVYHRFFYPDDLDGTLAGVAPHSFSTSDQRYVDFVNNVGGDEYKQCREDIKTMQVRLLQSAEEIVPTLSGNFSHLGGAAIAFEHSVIESAFYFWQYGNPDHPALGCKSIPAKGTVQELFQFLQKLADIKDYSDEGVARFLPYYYQAASQLGNPGNVTSHLEPLRLFEFTIDQYTPKGVSYTYSNAAIHQVGNWVKNEADKVMFIYGELDPWTAAEFPGTETGKAVYKYYVPKGNHGAQYIHLPAPERDEAIQILATWLNKSPVPQPPKTILRSGVRKKVESLEEIEFKERPRL